MSDPISLPPVKLFAEVQGTVALCTETRQAASALAASHYQAALDAEFSGDPVETYALPAWLPPLASFLPHEELLTLGLRPNTSDRPELVGTCGIDAHVDSIHGLVLIVVLFNDGLAFRQGKSRHVTAPGQWFVFDDRKPHAVKETARSTCFLAVAVPVVSVR